MSVRACLFPRLCVVLVALLSAAQSQDDATRMRWVPSSDNQALCNDFTQAGYFMRRNESSDKWVIFLESGSLCFSNDTCNRRFFNEEVRPEIIDTGFDSPFGNFDPSVVYEMNRNLEYREYVNPLMTSMRCIVNTTIEGRDLLSANSTENPDFYAHNHILIPYCSSDLWLGSETQENSTHCECGDLDCFGYIPDAEKLQFTFRGKQIFQSIFRDLLAAGMSEATEVLLGGSSAGGVGAVNHAEWVKDELPSDAALLLLLDSAWFINFQDGIFRIFDGTANRQAQTSTQMENNMRLFNILDSHDACRDDSNGYPCCISAHCVMTTINRTTHELAHFPEVGVRTFVLGSVYDVFLLAPAISGLEGFEEVAEEGGGEETTGLLVSFLRVVGEYGGEMNFTLAQTFNQDAPAFSYYLTQCFQHVYLATSTLWGDSDVSVFGTAAIDLSEELVSFTHSIASGRWNSLSLTVAGNVPLTPHEAITRWYSGDDARYLDDCQGPYCNPNCPDMFVLGELTSNNWPVWARIVISSAVVCVALLCLVTKVMFTLWLYRLEKKQDDYLDSLDEECEGRLEFPFCSDDSKVAVSCLDLTYTVTFKTNKNVKDESKDKTQAVVLNDLEDDTQEQEEIIESKRASRALRRRSRFSTLAGTIIRRSAAIATTPADSDPEKSLNMVNYAAANSNSPPPTPTSDHEMQPITDPPSDAVYNSCGCQSKRRKEILKGISIYFNPGEMIGIMGPSGCGKTTLLDLLTGRRRGSVGGDIYVNGIPMNEIRDWYIANTGYVLQLATPYYEELTVRDNLTLAAQIKLPETKDFTFKDKFKRVEQVMEVTGLASLCDTVVGADTGPGLSGGQKRRLVIALQLLKLPSVIFLDEPTSGLDATSSMELLGHLNKLAETNRTVILTIHQPRFEIFHMFHKLVLLSDGKVAYHGAPEKAYEVFVSALRENYLEKGLIIPSLGDHNPADVIMDMLGNPHFRRILTEYYQESNEPKLVKYAVKVARWKEYSQSSSSVDSIGTAVGFAIFGAKKVGQRHAHTFTRMAAMEARGSKRISFSQLAFLPFMFFAFAVVLGTVYLQSERAFLVVSGMCVFSVASGLFVFPAIEIYYTPALRVYNYERADGVGRSHDLVLQGFARYISIAFVPVILSSGLIYLLLINHEAYDLLVFLQVTVVNIALNITWTSLLIALMLAFPKTAFRMSSAIASVFGFTSGFFIPINQIGWWYRWISYINPNYYGFSSVAFFLLEDFNLCDGSQFECFVSSGAFTLRQFFFHEVNPYLHLLILFGFSVFFLMLAMFVNWLRHTSFGSKLTRLIAVIIRKPPDELSKEMKQDMEGYQRSISMATSVDDEFEVESDINLDDYEDTSSDPTSPLEPIAEEVVREEEVGGVGPEEVEAGSGETTRKIRSQWQNVAGKSLEDRNAVSSSGVQGQGTTGSGWGKVKMVRISDDPKRPDKLTLRAKRASKPTPFLSEGERHMVWRPKKRPELAKLVELLKETRQEDAPEKPEKPVEKSPVKPPTGGPWGALLTPSRTPSLRSRQKTLFNRVIATQAVLKETTDELLNEDKPLEEVTKKPRHITLLDASKKVTASLKKQKSTEENSKNFSDIVSKYLAKSRAESASSEEGSAPASATGLGPTGVSGGWGTVRGASRKPLQRKETRGAISLQTLRELVREEKQTSGGESDEKLKRRSAGGFTFTTTPGSNGHASLHDTAMPAEPPREIKLNKMAQLKKAAKERNQQRQQNELERPLDQVVEEEEEEEEGVVHDTINTSDHVTISSLEEEELIPN